MGYLSTYSRRRGAAVAALALIAIAYTLWFFRCKDRVYRADMEMDERGWIAAGLVYCDLAATDNLNPSAWDQLSLGTFGNLNPHVGEFAICFPAYYRARQENLVFEPQKHLTNKDTWGVISPGIPPPPPRIHSAVRWTVVFWAFLASAAMTGLAWWMGGPAVAVIFAFTLLQNDWYVHHSAVALTDQPYLFFLALGAICGAWLLSTTDAKQWAAAVAGMGLAAGLATSVKITGLVLLATYLLCLLSVLLWQKRTTRKRAGALLLLYFAVAVVPIYASNPFFWPDFSKMDLQAARSELRDLREGTSKPARSARETSLWKSLSAVDLRHSAFRKDYPQLRNVMRPMEFPLLYARWDRFMDQMANRFPLTSILEIPMGTLSRFGTSAFEVAFVLYGLVLAILQLRKGKGSPALLAGCLYLASQFGFLIAKMPVGFDRYFLPVFLISRIFVGIGVVAALEYPRQLLADLKAQRISTETKAL